MITMPTSPEWYERKAREEIGDPTTGKPSDVVDDLIAALAKNGIPESALNANVIAEMRRYCNEPVIDLINLVPIGDTRYFERRDANAVLIACGFQWSHENQCWIADHTTIRFHVRWSDTSRMFYISSV